MRGAESRKGQKRQLSPSDEPERKIKVLAITKDPRSGRHVKTVVEISNFTETTRRKPRHDARPSNGSNRPTRLEDVIFSARRTLNSNFKTLKEEMDALQVVRVLTTNGTLDEDFYNRFKNVKTRREKVEALLTELDRLMTESDDARQLKILPNFLKALQESGQDELATVLQTPSPTQNFICTRDEYNCMFRFFHNAKDKIIETVEPRRFLDDVVTINGINLQEYDDITNKSEREDRARELLVKISRARTQLRIIKPMCDCYSDLYSNFKSSEKLETANKNDVGIPVAVRFDFPETVAVEDTNEHSHLKTDIKKLQQRIVDTTNVNPAQFERLQEEISNDASLLLSRLSLSSVKLHLRTTSAMSLKELKECCENGKAIAWLMSLLKPDDFEKLKQLEATHGKLECYIDDEDSKKQLFDEAFEECLCVLNRDTLSRNITSFQGDLDGLELSVVEILLGSKTLDVTLAESLSQVKSNAAESEAKHVLTSFLLEEDVPQTCFCIIEKELTRNMKISTIQLLQGKVSGCQDLYTEDVNTIIKNNLKGQAELLEEELDGRWFLPSLKSRTEEKYMKIVKEIEKSRTRKSRTKPFVRFLCEEGDLEWFAKELEECQPHVLAILSQEKKVTELSVFRNSMLCIYDYIIKEVEPFELKSHLRSSCMDQLQFGKLESIRGRRERVFFFMKQLFKNKNLDRIQDVMDAFASKYTNIEKAIKDVSRQGSTCPHYRCPRIERHQMKMSKYIFVDNFTLPTLEKTGSDISTFYIKDAGTAMQPPKCQHVKLDIVLQEGSPQERLVEMSVDEVINKNLLEKANSTSDEQAVQANDGSDCEIQKEVEVSDKWSVRLPPSSSSVHFSETKPISAGENHSVKSINGIDKEEIRREMITETKSSKEDNGNTIDALPEEKSIYISKDETENKKMSNCEEKLLETSEEELKVPILEPFPTLASSPRYEKQLPNESSSSEFDKQYENEHIQCIPGISKEQTSELNGAKAPTQIQIMPLMSEMSKAKYDLRANDDLKECPDVQLQERSFKQNKDSATDSKNIHNKTSDQTLYKFSGSPHNHNRRSSGSFDRGSDESTRKFKMKLQPKPKPITDTQSNEFHYVRHNKPVSGNFTRQYENFRQQRNTEYWKEMERKRRQNEEYRYYEWLHTIRINQIVWQQQYMWMEHNAHYRGYSYPPWNRQYHNYG